MRLQGVKSLEEANEFLEGYLAEYNERFGVSAARPGDLHRPISKRVNLDQIFCLKTERSLRNDFTVAHEGKLYQVEDSIRADKVMVHEKLDGSILLMHKRRLLRFKEIVMRPVREKKRVLKRKRRIAIPPPDHSWRKFKFGRGKYEQPILPSP